jgi:hypothetical protein
MHLVSTMAYILVKMCLVPNVHFETVTMTYGSIKTCLVLAMAYILFEMHLALAIINIFLECTLLIITSLMFLLKH